MLAEASIHDINAFKCQYAIKTVVADTVFFAFALRKCNVFVEAQDSLLSDSGCLKKVTGKLYRD